MRIAPFLPDFWPLLPYWLRRQEKLGRGTAALAAVGKIELQVASPASALFLKKKNIASSFLFISIKFT